MSEKKNRQKDGNRGCLFLVFGTLCVIVGMLAYVLAVGRLSAWSLDVSHPDEPVYAIMTVQIPFIVVAFLLMDGILILKYLPSEEEYEKKASSVPGVKKKAFFGTKKATNLICLVLLVLIILCGCISVNTYRLVGEEGITTHFFADTSFYSWEEVTECRVDCDSDKGLSVTYIMENGKSFEVLRGTVSDTAAFADKYGYTLALAVEVQEHLIAQGIPCHVSHVERAVNFYRGNYPDLWPFVQILTGYEEIKPNDDETAGASDAGTAGADTADVDTTDTGTADSAKGE